MKIVSLSPSITDTLVALGLRDEIVGVSAYCKPYAPPHARIVGDYIRPRLEALEELKPDMVFTSGSAQEEARRILQDRGFRVVHLSLPSSLYGIIDMVWQVGVYTSRFSEAEELMSKLHEKFKELKGLLKSARIFYVIDLGGPVSPAALSYAGHALTHLGVDHAYKSKPLQWVEPLASDVKQFQPQVVVYEAKVPNPTEGLARRRLREWGLLLDGDIKLAVVPVDTLAHYGPMIAENMKKLVHAVGRVLYG